MPISNHPGDERLAALAGHDADAIADAELSSHVISCDRCAALVDELGALRAALADLPDIAPTRPLRLLPPLEPEPASAADRLGGWARRFFAPVLASGAALALVGAIGTAGPAFVGQQAAAPSEGGAAGGADAAQEFAAEPSESSAFTLEGAPAAAPSGEEATRESTDSALAPVTAGESLAAAAEAASEDEAPASDGSTLSVEDDDRAATGAPAAAQVAVERSPWPMVLFAGVALMVAAVLLRWILAPRPA
jgi:hypothetical protein